MNILFVLTCVVHCFSYVQSQGRVRVVNKCNEPLLIRTELGSWLSRRLNAGQETEVTFPYERPQPRVWALRGCRGTDERTCKDFYGTNIQYNSLAEFNWKNGQLWYDISLVDGYTTGLSMAPFIPGNPRECEPIYCRYDTNTCKGRKIYNRGELVGCQNPSKDQETNYSRHLKRKCPTSYTWSKDDEASKYTCFPNRNNGLRIEFLC